MSDIIQLLPDSVANQIAAGEVIQRPASVIKELVENAIDAGASAIQVIVTDAGRTNIQVIDNGKGMSETDARMSFERHATSKIRKADDLFNLHTMGFRGEALASIAAVAQVELRTRTAATELGTLINVAGCKVTNQEPVSCPVGSNFKVENLFFNVPARRKFLKTNATELNNIITAFERIVLVYPEISFTLSNNDNELMNLRAGSLKQRIVDLFGKRISQDLLSINIDTSLCKITGFVGKPESAKKKGAREFFFVNGRYMKHPYFHKAVMNVFERLVPSGMLVPYFIYFDVNPNDIDVNIHPTKTEIKFENEQAIWQILTAAVNDAIGKFCEVSAIDFETEGKPEMPIFNPVFEGEMPQVELHPTYNPFSTTPSSSPSVTPKVDKNWQQLYARQEAPLFPEEQSQLEIIEKSPTHYQYKGRFIMTAVKSGLMIIDQHRADIRIRYEQYLDNTHPMQTQRVLFPEVLQLSVAEELFVQKIQPELEHLGFELTPMGQGSFAVNGVPAGTEGLDPITMLKEMIGHLDEYLSSSGSEIHKQLALSLAIQAALPEGQVLSNVEMESLINRLFLCQNVNYTPHGKRITHILPQRDIETLFGT